MPRRPDLRRREGLLVLSAASLALTFVVGYALEDNGAWGVLSILPASMSAEALFAYRRRLKSERD